MKRLFAAAARSPCFQGLPQAGRIRTNLCAGPSDTGLEKEEELEPGPSGEDVTVPLEQPESLGAKDNAFPGPFSMGRGDQPDDELPTRDDESYRSPPMRKNCLSRCHKCFRLCIKVRKSS